uniref:Uncharacterized protein n=1 Tax=Panagrolaimus superbus TaxID=310955 RepID=A0A914YBS0_9BILA
MYAAFSASEADVPELSVVAVGFEVGKIGGFGGGISGRPVFVAVFCAQDNVAGFTEAPNLTVRDKKI